MFGALALGGVMLGFGGLFGVVGAVEQELPALAIGGFFGGLGVVLGLFLLDKPVWSGTLTHYSSYVPGDLKEGVYRGISCREGG